MINAVGTTKSTLITNENKKFSENIKAQQTKEIANQKAQIKESVKNNTYQIDLQKTSEKMALNLLNL
ncbi:flagellar biosynthesis anti-sigma factor FlgM [Helicobacter sp. 11S03491-1]|uniref:flagellar biosynthesis anti-sigma factor FlgM n=1 Tax=Helicobacter sp. 11S03491-1 TaxID=1476196 RepID=UPI000BA51DF4|nr:flagellar biosynthesis anti-sigma factor FlgM [Helicobacter sp. 11S03491-1]PAF42238.1 hypothetical protein BKH45_04650 [Helicobacter sp. 11S03491-1]